MPSDFQLWLKTRPESVRALATRYPPGRYRILEGAPYGVTCPGTVVELYSYTEDGEVGVILRAADKLPEALVHERGLSELHGRGPFHGDDILAHIDPKWMTLIDDHAELVPSAT